MDDLHAGQVAGLAVLVLSPGAHAGGHVLLDVPHREADGLLVGLDHPLVAGEFDGQADRLRGVEVEAPADAASVSGRSRRFSNQGR